MKRLKKYAFYGPFIVAGALAIVVPVPPIPYFLTGCGVVTAFGATAYIVASELTRE